MAIRIVVLVVVALLLAALVYLFVLRQPVEAPSTVYPGVTIECEPWTDVSAEACGSWGDAILAAGPPSRTFNMTDLARLAIDRPWLGFGAACRVEYFLGRHPDRAVWDEETACAGGD